MVSAHILRPILAWADGRKLCLPRRGESGSPYCLIATSVSPYCIGEFEDLLTKYVFMVLCACFYGSQNGNFGLQPEQLVGALPEALQPALQGILSSMPQEEDGSMAPWCTSLAGAYVFTEVFEIVRLPATVLLLPSIPHLIGAAPAADPSGSTDTTSGSS